MEERIAYLIENGVDMDNEEACALTAETIQLEYEAYNVRQQANGKGYGGFQPKQFDVSGQLSFQERKARLQQLKSRTECRCHQRGHWSGDPQCPKGGRKGSLHQDPRLWHPLRRPPRAARVAKEVALRGSQNPVLCTSVCMRKRRLPRIQGLQQRQSLGVVWHFEKSASHSHQF